LSEAYSERQLREIEHHASYRWPLKSWLVNESMLPQKYAEYVRALDGLYPDARTLHGKRVLDCGCGFGAISVILAKRGASVEAFDISPNMVGIAQRLIRENSVEASVTVREGALENLCHPAGTFDLAVGTTVLHHTDIEPAAREIHRVLKPGGRAVFWEPIVKSPLREAMRKLYRRFLTILVHGSEDEHPLTREEIAILERVLGEVRIRTCSAAPLSLILNKLLPLRIPRIRRMVEKVDVVIDRALPFLRRLETSHILVFTKAA
jgi:2-polyprenyl-3-methyl-5-hydroxy-6-metoxy-1,4-benzoquinol methylase